MNELNARYGLLLGLNESLEVVGGNVDPEARLMEIHFRHRGGELV